MRTISRGFLLLTIGAVFALGMAATAFAAPSGIHVSPWTYDPDNTGISQGAWVTGEGLPDAGNSNHAL